MDRRSVLKYAVMAAMGGTLGASLQSIVNASEAEPHWGYIGPGSPEQWGNISADYRICSIGADQSPIDLHAPIRAELENLEISYQPSPLKILNNGHTVQVNYVPGSTLRLDGQVYDLLQFHFHTPSEHTLEQRQFEMELHLVHKHPETNNLAVLGIFIKEGATHPGLSAIWPYMPLRQAPETTIDHVAIDARQLLPPEITHFYRYRGSLTTPPCSEVVDWVVLEQPIEASKEQIAQLRSAVGTNARPVQSLNRRILLFR
jgi:carbonic anhydrase